MTIRRSAIPVVMILLAGGGVACGTSGADGSGGGATTSSSGAGGNPNTNPSDGPPAGNPEGHCTVPIDGIPEDTSQPDTVIGDGTPASCTSAAVVAAVAKGGVITFSCGPDPIVITLTETAKVVNDANPRVVLDGGNKVTLSGGGKVRILYQNTCDQAQHYTSSHCQDQDTPKLTVQNITFVDGNATGAMPEGAGGAIFDRGGRLKIIHSRFFHDVCDPAGPDVGGGAVRALDQSMGLPVYVIQSTFGGTQPLGNVGANGGALSSIGVSWTVVNSLFAFNQAIGTGASSGMGGNGGAIYNDGNTYHLDVCGTAMHDNSANEGGGAIFFVSNDKSGSFSVTDSTLTHNPSGKFETMPGIFYIASGPPDTTGSTIQ